MKNYHVTFYYLVYGMDGVVDERDYGVVEAKCESEARSIIATREFPKDKKYGPGNSYSARDFFKGCLRAKET